MPQSIGPIEGSFQRALARLVFNRAALILLRERRSLDFLRVLRVSRPAHVLPDLAFGLPPVTDEVSKGDVLQIGVTVIDRSAQDKKFDRQQVYEDALASLLVRLSKDYRAHISIFVQCYGPSPDQDDRRSARRLYDRVREQTDAVTLREQFRDALAIRVAYRQMDCMIGTRMHTAIFAFSGGVPVVLIGYQPKAQGIMEQFGLERYWCSIEAVTEAELCRMVCEALDRWEEIRQHIAQRYTQTQEFLQDWTKYLLA